MTLLCFILYTVIIKKVYTNAYKYNKFLKDVRI